MACPGRHLSSIVFLALLTSVFVRPAMAQVKPCEELKEEIAEKIRTNGVPAFDLFILHRDEETPWKIVGTCNGGQGKIAYARGTPREQAATLRANEAARQASGSAAPPSNPEPSTARSMPAPAPAPATAAPATAPSEPPRTASADTRSGDDIGAALWTGGEERQCHMVKPRGWQTDRALYGDSDKPPSAGQPIRAFETDILPPAGDDLAGKGVALSFRIRTHYLHELRPLMLVSYPDADRFNAMLDKPPSSLTGNERDFRDSAASLARANPDEWKWATGMTKPGLIDGVGAVRLLVAPDVDWKPVEAFRFRAREQGKKSTDISTHRIRIWSDGRALRTQAVLNPVYHSTSGGGPLTERLVYEYGCWASMTMPPQDFIAICRSYIERSTLGPDFPAGQCVAATSGIAFAPR